MRHNWFSGQGLEEHVCSFLVFFVTCIHHYFVSFLSLYLNKLTHLPTFFLCFCIALTEKQLTPKTVEKTTFEQTQNKTRTSKVGAISKAQKAQNNFLGKNLKFLNNFFFKKSRLVPKNVQGGPFWFY